MAKSSAKEITKGHILVVPTYNCAKQVAKLFDGIIEQNQYWDQIWFIDNRSRDNTVSILQECKEKVSEIQAKIKIFINKENFGLGGTHKVAFEKAMSEGLTTITILHGDNQAKVDDAVKALKIFQEGQGKFVLGTRFSKNAKLNGYSKLRILFNVSMNILLSLKLRTKIYDLGSGINVFSIEEMKDLNLDELPNDLTFNIEMLKWLIISKKRIHWCPIAWTEEDQVSNVKVLRQTFKTLLLITLPFGKFGEGLDLIPRTLEVE